MKLSLLVTVLSSCVAMSFVIKSAEAQSSITEHEAYAIGVDAYLYFYPLVTMDITRKQLTNVESGKGLGGPMNKGYAADRRSDALRLDHRPYEDGWSSGLRCGS
jgi:hypothetical protein